MTITNKVVEQILLENSKAPIDKLHELYELADKDGTPLQDAVLKEKILSEYELTELYSKYINMPFVALDPKTIDLEVLKTIPERIAKRYRIVAYDIDDDGNIMLAVNEPDDIQAIDFLKKEIGEKLVLSMTTKDSVNQVLGLYRQNLDSQITETVQDDEEENEEVAEYDIGEDSPITKTVNLIIEYAIHSGASDIHIEPHAEFVQVRYRIDGVLKEVNRLPKRSMMALVSRIKILSNLKIDERRAPQDGRFKINVNEEVFAFRVSTLPILNGEKVVMRVLDESSEPLTLDQLGFWGAARKHIEESIKRPHGMLLVTGPTGSGKSTTLHSVLNMLNKPEVNISTVEDPVEYRLEGVNQTQVNVKAGMTFINGLRALLRQDPNIIMVGEIRDAETAGLGVQASLTGHLVFSTLHTNNAATCLPRLLDMEIEPFLISSVVHAVIGQRLVRKIHLEDCEEYEPTGDALASIQKSFGIESEDEWNKTIKLAKVARESFGKPAQDKVTFLRPKPDLPEEKSGYKGRMGIYEVLAISEPIKGLIVANGTSTQIQNQAIKDGMITMQTDGLIKAMCGLTSIEEIMRVTRE